MGTVETLVRIVVSGVLSGAAYLAFLGYRTDYVGHFLAGMGGTLFLLSFALGREGRTLRWEPVVLALLAILLGAGTEATVFCIAIFDPVDFLNQSLGAGIAAACVLGSRASTRTATATFLLSFVFLVVGALYAFA